MEIKKEFFNKLADLLEEYDAEIIANLDWACYLWVEISGEEANSSCDFAVEDGYKGVINAETCRKIANE